MTHAAEPVVLDSSVLLALLKGEMRASAVAPLLRGGVVPSVIWAETLGVCYRQGLSESWLNRLVILGLQFAPFSREQAELAAGLQLNLARLGLSLADCCCLAVGIDLDIPVYTADSAWERLDQPVDVRLVR